MNVLLENRINRIKSLQTFTYTPRWIILIIDMAFSFLSVSLAYLIIINFDIHSFSLHKIFNILALFLAVRGISFLIFKPFSGIVRYTGSQDAVRILMVVTVGSVFILILNAIYHVLFNSFFLPFSVLAIDYFVLLSEMVLFRVLIKTAFNQYVKRSGETQSVVVYGSDEYAIMVKHALDNSEGSCDIVAFIDHQNKKAGKKLEGVNIYKSSALEDILQKKTVDKLIIAKKDISVERKREVVELGLKYDISVMEVPKFDSWINGELSVRQIKKVKIEDLLERETIKLNEEELTKQILNKSVLVTGAAGSIGSEIVRQLTRFNPSKIIIFDQAESPLYDIELELREELQFFNAEIVIGDMRDKDRMEKIFSTLKPDLVYHAAAYKHVPMMENNPSEAIKTNVFGTANVAELAVKYGAERFVMVSTDKAVNPTNVMGASKRIAEIYTQSLNGKTKTAFITTRFGNVLGSNGSVIPRFKKQIEAGGPVTVTHPEITRYFMTIPEACQLVLQAGALGHGGEIFVFDMGESVKIVDLARKMIQLSGYQLGKDINISFTGLRPGEKLYEELLNVKENTLPTVHPRIMIAKVREYEHQEVIDMVEGFNQYLDGCDNFEIVRHMKVMVPEFKSKNSIYEQLDLDMINNCIGKEVLDN
jgi:FlaA1/EpsC-like NDP-sugar epimerase